MVCCIHNAVNVALGKPEVDEAGIKQLYNFYTACRCGKANVHGRAFVVVHTTPTHPAETNTDSIIVHRALLEQECQSASVEEAPKLV